MNRERPKNPTDSSEFLKDVFVAAILVAAAENTTLTQEQREKLERVTEKFSAQSQSNLGKINEKTE